MRIMGLDYGTKTVGVAISDALKITYEIQNLEQLKIGCRSSFRSSIFLCIGYEKSTGNFSGRKKTGVYDGRRTRKKCVKV